jgi:regulator of protease activity HflC (stomatin/prohibitin superfamily)
MPEIAAIVAALLAIVLVAVLGNALFERVSVAEYQQGLLYRDGRFQGLLRPGGYWILRPRSTVRLVDTRLTFYAVQGQELVTSDGVSVKVSLVLQQRVVDAPMAIHSVSDYVQGTYAIAQVALREVVAGLTVEEVLQRRGEIGADVLARSVQPVRALGIELVAVDVKDLMLPAATKRLLNQVVDARQKGLAALEKARGETAALRSLANAARMVEANPALLQLRLLQQLESSSGNTVLLGLPPTSSPIPVRQVGGPVSGTEDQLAPDAQPSE